MDRDGAQLADITFPDAELMVPAIGRRELLPIPAQITLKGSPSEGDESPDPALYPRLEYIWTTGLSNLSSPEIGPCLDEFIRIDQGPDSSIASRVLEFAKRWGPLGICGHGVVAGHSSRLGCTASSSGRSTQWFSHDVGWEPIEAWSRYIRHVRALLLLVRQLHEGEPGDRRDWDDVEAVNPDVGPDVAMQAIVMELASPGWRGPIPLINEPWKPDQLGDVAEERHAVGKALHRWLELGRVELKAFWMNDRPVPSIDLAFGGFSRSLYGVLAVQIAAMMRSPKGIYQCVGCGMPFTPDQDGGRRRSPKRRP